MTSGPVVYCCCPLMLAALGALVTRPPHLTVGVYCDKNVAEMGIFGMIPLVLQQGAELAVVWCLLLACAEVLQACLDVPFMLNV